MTSLLNNDHSQVQLLKQDGLQFGTLTATNFDERGNLEVTYSNGEKKKIGRLVLAQLRFERRSERRWATGCT